VTAGRPPIVQDGPDVLLAVRVHPRASRNQLVATAGGPGRHDPEIITIRLTAPPAEGAANAACRAFLADLLGIAQSRILIVLGETSRNKLLRVRDADAASILARLRSTE
jgi:uncharacterized protein YggU (UPF0235/DUF167 family)